MVRIYDENGTLVRSFAVDTDGSGDGMSYDEFMNGGGSNNWNGVVAEGSGNGYYDNRPPSGDPNGPWWDNRDGTNSYTNPRGLNEVSVRPSAPAAANEWARFAFGFGASAYVNALGFQFEVGGSIVYFPYSSSLAGYVGGSAGVSPSIGAGASIDAKPYIFYSMDKQPLQFSDLKGRGQQINVTLADASGSILWGNNSDGSLNYVGIGVGPGAGASASYNVSWYDGYHIITVPLPNGQWLPIPVADRPGINFPQE